MIMSTNADMMVLIIAETPLGFRVPLLTKLHLSTESGNASG